ncbi:MAG: hypothetical protein U1E65_16025 [Myxococcota bacterium]
MSALLAIALTVLAAPKGEVEVVVGVDPATGAAQRTKAASVIQHLEERLSTWKRPEVKDPHRFDVQVLARSENRIELRLLSDNVLVASRELSAKDPALQKATAWMFVRSAIRRALIDRGALGEGPDPELADPTPAIPAAVARAEIAKTTAALKAPPAPVPARIVPPVASAPAMAAATPPIAAPTSVAPPPAPAASAAPAAPLAAPVRASSALDAPAPADSDVARARALLEAADAPSPAASTAAVPAPAPRAEIALSAGGSVTLASPILGAGSAAADLDRALSVSLLGSAEWAGELAIGPRLRVGLLPWSRLSLAAEAGYSQTLTGDLRRQSVPLSLALGLALGDRVQLVLAGQAQVVLHFASVAQKSSLDAGVDVGLSALLSLPLSERFSLLVRAFGGVAARRQNYLLDAGARDPGLFTGAIATGLEWRWR